MPEISENDLFPPVISIPERVKIVLEYLMSGHEMQIEGRRLLLFNLPPYPSGKQPYALVARAENLIYEHGKLVKQSEGTIGYNVNFTHFLTMVQEFSYTDLLRMQQVTKQDGMK